jgi:hypothetical protein
MCSHNAAIEMAVPESASAEEEAVEVGDDLLSSHAMTSLYIDGHRRHI